MKVNQEGLDIIKHFEGYSSTVYADPIGIPTIGFGSIWDKEGNRLTMDHEPITEQEGEFLLVRELKHVESAIARLIRVELTENQFSAIASLTFNIGSGRLKSSTLRAKINREDYSGASAEFPKWRRAGGRILKGLVRRRKAERELFNA